MRAAFVHLGDILQHGLDTVVVSILKLRVFGGRKGDIAWAQAVVMQENDTRMVGWNVLDDMLKGHIVEQYPQLGDGHSAIT